MVQMQDADSRLREEKTEIRLSRDISERQHENVFLKVELAGITRKHDFLVDNAPCRPHIWKTSVNYLFSIVVEISGVAVISSTTVHFLLCERASE